MNPVEMSNGHSSVDTYGETLQQLVDVVSYQTDVFVIFSNMFLGLVIGYLMVKGMTIPWN